MLNVQGMLNVSDLVKGTTVEFLYYRQGNLMYKVVEKDFEFPVPISDTNDATFPVKEKALFFMRWIRKQVAYINLVDPPGGGTPND